MIRQSLEVPRIPYRTPGEYLASMGAPLRGLRGLWRLDPFCAQLVARREVTAEAGRTNAAARSRRENTSAKSRFEARKCARLQRSQIPGFRHMVGKPDHVSRPRKIVPLTDAF